MGGDVLGSFGIANIIAFDLVFYRALGFFYICPYFLDKRVPHKVIIVFSLCFAYILSLNPELSEHVIKAIAFGEHLKWGVLNFVVGSVVGLMVLLCMELIRLTGKLIAYAMQLGFSQMVDPTTGSQGDVIGTSLYFLFSLFFISSGGLMVLIDMFLFTFSVIPLTGFVIKSSVFYEIAMLFGATFLYGVVLAIPFMAVSLLLNVGLGVISKAAPSMNLFSIGFPMAILMGIFGMYLIMPTLISDLFIYFLKLKESYMELIV